MNKQIYPCLWFDGNAKEAATFYCTVFKDAKLTSENPVVVMFEIKGQTFMCLNGGPQFSFNESVSFVVNCDSQEEIDHYWQALIANGGQEGQCGWLKDQFGLSWQIVPSMMGSWMQGPEKAQRVMQALMKMTKLEIELLKNA